MASTGGEIESEFTQLVDQCGTTDFDFDAFINSNDDWDIAPFNGQATPTQEGPDNSTATEGAALTNPPGEARAAEAPMAPDVDQSMPTVGVQDSGNPASSITSPSAFLDAPTIPQAALTGTQPGSTGTQPAPANARAASAGAQVAPADTQAAPVGTQAAPVGTQAASIGNQAAPVSTQSAAIGNEAAPIASDHVGVAPASVCPPAPMQSQMPLTDLGSGYRRLDPLPSQFTSGHQPQGSNGYVVGAGAYGYSPGVSHPVYHSASQMANMGGYQQPMPQQMMSQQGMSQNHVHQQTMPQQTMPQQSMYQQPMSNGPMQYQHHPSGYGPAPFVGSGPSNNTLPPSNGFQVHNQGQSNQGFQLGGVNGSASTMAPPPPKPRSLSQPPPQPAVVDPLAKGKQPASAVKTESKTPASSRSRATSAAKGKGKATAASQAKGKGKAAAAGPSQTWGVSATGQLWDTSAPSASSAGMSSWRMRQVSAPQPQTAGNVTLPAPITGPSNQASVSQFQVGHLPFPATFAGPSSQASASQFQMGNNITASAAGLPNPGSASQAQVGNLPLPASFAGPSNQAPASQFQTGNFALPVSGTGPSNLTPVPQAQVGNLAFPANVAGPSNPAPISQVQDGRLILPVSAPGPSGLASGPETSEVSKLPEYPVRTLQNRLAMNLTALEREIVLHTAARDIFLLGAKLGAEEVIKKIIDQLDSKSEAYGLQLRDLPAKEEGPERTKVLESCEKKINKASKKWVLFTPQVADEKMRLVEAR